MRSQRLHILDYLILISGLGLFVGLFWFFRYQKDAQLLITFLGCLFYFMWGIFHHLVEHRLTKLIFFEYISISIFSFVLVFVLLSL